MMRGFTKSIKQLRKQTLILVALSIGLFLLLIIFGIWNYNHPFFQADDNPPQEKSWAQADFNTFDLDNTEIDGDKITLKKSSPYSYVVTDSGPPPNDPTARVNYEVAEFGYLDKSNNFYLSTNTGGSCTQHNRCGGNCPVVKKFSASNQNTNNQVFGFDRFGNFDDWSCDSPNRVAIDNDGNLYISTTYSWKIMKVSSSGEFIMERPIPAGAGSGVVWIKDALYTIGQGKLTKFDDNLNVISEKVHAGFQYDTYLGDFRTDSDDNLYVAPYSAPIYKYDSSGNFLYTINPQNARRCGSVGCVPHRIYLDQNKDLWINYRKGTEDWGYQKLVYQSNITSGTVTLPAFDAGFRADWLKVLTTSQLPVGTQIYSSIRVAESLDDLSVAPFVPLTPGLRISGQYAQLQLLLQSYSLIVSPSVQTVTLQYAQSPDLNENQNINGNENTNNQCGSSNADYDPNFFILTHP